MLKWLKNIETNSDCIRGNISNADVCPFYQYVEMEIL